MKKLIYFSFLAFIGLLCFEACHKDNKKAKAKPIATADSAKACAPTIKDPNNPKPMALTMRVMAAHADSMHSRLLRGEFLDSTQYPFIKFYLVEPTDPKVLEPQFFENARMFQIAHQQLFAHPKEQRKYYNLLINSCIHCHESYCSGPLKRIRKFPI